MEDCAKLATQSLLFGVFVGALGGAVMTLLGVLALVVFAQTSSDKKQLSWKEPLVEEKTFLINGEEP